MHHPRIIAWYLLLSTAFICVTVLTWLATQLSPLLHRRRWMRIARCALYVANLLVLRYLNVFDTL